MKKMNGEEISGVYDVVVVGAGIMGSCIAYEIAKRGRSVMLLEQYDFLHRRGSSHGESRAIRVTYPEEYYTVMMFEAYRLWEEAQFEAGYAVYHKTGQLDLGHCDNQSFAAVISSLKKFGIGYELYTPEQLSDKYPMVTLPEGWLALYTAQGGILRASKAVAMFQSLASKNGATLRDRAKVLNISPNWKSPDGLERVLVATSRGSTLAGKCVLAAGAWTSKLVKEMMGFSLPIQPLHTTIAYWEVEDQQSNPFSATNGFPVFATYSDLYIYGSPSIEYPGMIKVGYHSGNNCDPDKRTVAPDQTKLKELVSPWLSSTFKGQVKCNAPVFAEGCMYSMTPDEDFILDFLPPRCLGSIEESTRQSQILIAGGFSGHGFKMGPLVGRVMADLALTGVAHGIPLELFSIRRFHNNPQGNRKDYEVQVVNTE